MEENIGIAPLVLASGAMLTKNIDDYPAGIIIPVDKPYTWTSADVIRKIKFAAVRHFGKKNLKVGHAGTLDPLATGVLLVCIGKATKLAEALQAHDKEYIAGITFGATTPSYDREKEIDRFYPHEHITEEDVRKAMESFIGEQDQIAPLFSAKSVEGVRAYEIARKMIRRGETEGIDEAAADLIRTARIRIDSMELLSFDAGTGKSAAPNDKDAAGIGRNASPVPKENALSGEMASVENPAMYNTSGKDGKQPKINVTDNSALGLPTATIKIACSKGTYIRALARDLGEALGSGAHLDSLQRSRSGDFRVENALSVDEVLAILKR